MKNILLFPLFFIIIIFSCKKEKNNSQEIAKTDSIKSQLDTNQETKKVNKSIIELKYLPEIVSKQDKEFQNKFNEYLKALNSEISSEQDLINVFDMRDSLKSDFENMINNFYDDNADSDYELWTKVEKECDTIGFHSFYAEGMFVGFGISPILLEEVKKYASEPLKIYMNFRYAYSLSEGGEYPYSSLYEYYNALVAGQKIITHYKNTEYFNKMFSNYFYCLNVCTDIHSIDNDRCFYIGFTDEDYPYMSSCEWDSLIQKFPKSLFVPVLKKLKENHSDISTKIIERTSKNSGQGYIYAVITNKTDDEDAANRILFDYMVKGIDVVHKLTLNDNDSISIYTCYRFYSDKNLAIEAFEKISKQIPNCKIYVIEKNTEDYYPDGKIIDKIQM